MGLEQVQLDVPPQTGSPELVGAAAQPTLLEKMRGFLSSPVGRVVEFGAGVGAALSIIAPLAQGSAQSSEPTSPQTEPRATVVTTAANHETPLDQSAAAMVRTLGTRIINLARSRSNGTGGSPIVRFPNSSLEAARLTVDVNGPTGRAFPYEYYMTVLMPKTRGDRIDTQGIRAVDITEGIKNNITYVDLEFAEDIHTGAWEVVDNYMTSKNSSATLQDVTIKAATRQNLFGVKQQRITPPQLHAAIGFANSIVNEAKAGKPTGFKPPAF